MLLYAAPIWVEATLYKWCKNKLRSVQRLILPTILKSFKTISTPSALILSGSIPMEMRAQKLSIQSQIKRLNSPTTRFHMQNSCFITAILQHCSITLNQLDLPRDSFLRSPSCTTRNFPITITSMSQPARPSLPMNTGQAFLFTNGQKTALGTALAVVLTDDKEIRRIIQRRLPNNANQFEAESCAIIIALKLIQISFQRRYASITLYTNSKSSLQALNSSNLVPDITFQIQKETAQILTHCNFNMVWLPGHLKTDGNSLAEKFSCEAINKQNIPLCNIRTTWTNIKPILETFFQNSWKREKEWKTYQRSQITKTFFPSAASAFILQKITTPHQLIQILSGHCRLNSSLYNINVVDDPICNCKMEIETINHFLFDCPQHHLQRIKFKEAIIKTCNRWPPSLCTISKTIPSLNALKSFCVPTKRLDFNL